MRIVYVLLSLCCACPFAFCAENKLQMVSYFPVPYVAYNDVTVTQFCDVGLLNQCAMNVGPGDAGTHTYVLNIGLDPEISGANVLNTGTTSVENGRLNLNSSGPASRVYSSRADVGMMAGLSDTQGSGEISVGHTANVSSVPAARSVSASTTSLLKSLQVYPTRLNNNFPGCPAGVKWAKVPLNGNSDSVVLVCGDGANLNVCDPASKPKVSEPCPTGCGTRTRRVWCNNGVWVAEGWSPCGNKPESTVPCTSASYDCGASATRTVSCNGTNWTTTAWSYSACFNQYGGGQSKGCSSGCGTQTSTSSCSGAVWNTSGCYSPSGPGYCSCSSCGSAWSVSTCSGGYCDYGGCYSESAPSCSCSGNGGCGSAYGISSCSGGYCNYGGCYSPSAPSSCSCPSGKTCGSARRISSCSGGSCDTSSCSAPYGGGTETRACASGYSGTQSRSCPSTCSGRGTCGAWTGTCTKNDYCDKTCATGECSSQTCVKNSSGGYCSGTATNKKGCTNCVCPSGTTGSAYCTPACGGGSCNTSGCRKQCSDGCKQMIGYGCPRVSSEGECAAMRGTFESCTDYNCNRQMFCCVP